MPSSSNLLLKSLSLLSSIQPPTHISLITMPPSPSSQQFLHHSPKPKKIQSFTTACVDVLQKSNLSVDGDVEIDGCVYYNNYMKLCKPGLSDVVSVIPICQNGARVRSGPLVDEIDVRVCSGVGNDLWMRVRDEARADVQEEPILGNYYYNLVLKHQSLSCALANLLAMKLSNSSLSIQTLYDLLLGVFVEDTEIVSAVEDDLRAVKERDPACVSFVHCLLNFKGFHACQAHRVAHKLWTQGRKVLALVIQSRVSEVFAVDIHPGARIGRRILIDHATGLVVGETAVIGDDVSILHNVTLGGTGKVSGDRHPKIGDGVLIGAGTCVLGNVKIGSGAKIGAGSVVLKDIPPRTTAVGNPARLIGGKENPVKLDKIPSLTMDQTSHISEWSDYVI